MNHKDPRTKCRVCNAKPEYEALAAVFGMALFQAQDGKGKERHAPGDIPFTSQPIFEIARTCGKGFLTGQAIKKLQEVHVLPTREAQVAELLGAIVYAAAAVIYTEEKESKFVGIPSPRNPPSIPNDSPRG